MSNDNVLRGRVFEQSTGRGIADLVVVVVDLDTAVRDQREHGRPDLLNLWQGARGDRLGSALTDDSGRFELRYADESFRERRPDLAAFVLAPETPGQTGADVLHASLLPRVDAGRSEALTVALPKRAVDAGTDGVPHVVADLVTLDRKRAQVAELLAARSTLNLTRSTNFRLKSAEFSGRILQARAAKAGDPTFVQPQAITSAAITGSVESGILRLQQADVVRLLNLDLPSSLVARWRTTTGGVAAPLRELLAHVREANGGVALERRRNWLDDCDVREEVQRRLSCGESSTSTETEPTSAGSPAVSGAAPRDTGSNSVNAEQATTALDELLQAHLARQLATSTSPESPLAYGARPDADVSATISAVSLKGGPADTRAFYDFCELKVCFDPLWTSMVDASLRESARHIYEQILRYDNQVSGVTDPQTVMSGDVSDFKQMLNDFRWFLSELKHTDPVPPELQRMVPNLRASEWTEFPEPIRQDILVTLSLAAAAFGLGNAVVTTARVLQLVEEGRAAIQNDAGRLASLQRMMHDIDQRLGEAYRFDVFAPNSMNFGLVLTYRQTWDPLEYQVGRLVSTVPLAPKETRKITVKRTHKRSRTQKELRDSETKGASERSDTNRAESEIVASARSKTSFGLEARAGVSIAGFEGGTNTTVGVESEQSSQTTKRNFREAVLKASEEYRQQHKLEVEQTQESTSEIQSESEISNPNDEITVTYLFYELQRQYRIREHLQRVEPVILVANQVPAPEEINEAWLLTHSWILRRVLLDNSFREAIEYVETSLAGDQLTLEVLRQNVERQSRVVDELGAEQEAKRDLAKRAFAKVEELVGLNLATQQNVADLVNALVTGPSFMFGALFGSGARERQEDVAKLALDRADKETQDVTARIAKEMSTLQIAVDKYVEAVRRDFDRKVQLGRLRIHVKQNILYYMQCIWDHEPTDQRYFRLYNLGVPWLEPPADARVELTPAPPDPFGLPDPNMPSRNPFFGRLRLDTQSTVLRKLYEVADLDNPLGYKGNYTVFRLRETSYLHDYMMQEYVDPTTRGLRDPDRLGDLSLDEIEAYACCLKARDPSRYAEEEPRLRELLARRIADPKGESDVVVIPTDQLMIEALPGKHPLLEDFKLVHRALDVKKVQAEVRFSELENVRAAARLLTRSFEDPQIDKLIRVDGTSEVQVDSE